MHSLTIPTPLGPLTLACDGSAITAVSFGAAPEGAGHPLLNEAARQLAEYFAGTRVSFTLPLRAAGTAFQQQVWGALSAIPHGQTRSYGDIARAIGRPRAVRAVGAANGRNPIAIIVPCHRVIGADGTLTGYGGGMDRKQWLLKHEASPT